MKILHVISSANPAGGGPIEAIRQSATQLARAGHTSELVCLDSPGARWLDDLPLVAHRLGPGRMRYGYSPQLTRWLEERHGSFDCVISHGLWEYTSLATWRALRGTKTPYFVYTHGMLDPAHRRTFPVRHVKKAVYWALAEHRVLRDARSVLFTCEQERDLAARAFRPYRCRPSIVQYCVATPPPVDAAPAERFFERYPALRDRRLLLFFSRIHPKKGCDLLIEAFARVAMNDRDLHLVMAGPDPGNWRPRLERLAKRLGIADRIEWTGMLLGPDKWSALRAAEVFVLPTFQENFGIAIVEALAVGTPVLITDQVNIWREIHEDGAALVSGVGLDATVELLRRWLKLEHGQQQQMRAAALQCYARRFQPETAARLLIDTLRGHGVGS